YERFGAGVGARGKGAREAWMTMFASYREAHPELADELMRIQRRELPDGWDGEIPEFPADPKGIASRDSSAQVLNALARHVPWLLGGAADLAPCTKTRLTFDGAGDFQADDRTGRNLHFAIPHPPSAPSSNHTPLTTLRPLS